MTNQILKWFWTRVAEWKYRKQEYDAVCCCGNDMLPIKITPTRGGSFDLYRCKIYDCPSRCAKEYAVTSYVEEKMK